MKILKRIFVIIAVILIIQILVVTINILQNGIGGWDGRSVDEILKVEAEKATIENIEKLSKAEFFQLFYAAEAPVFTKVKGEYKARLVPAGILSSINEYYAQNFMGPGQWEAKSFFPYEKRKGRGYNVFTVTDNGKSKKVRTIRMDTYIGKSSFDDKESFHLVYAAYNDNHNRTMRDEMRRINDRLYIALGYSILTLGAINPSPFVVYGEPGQWVGPDDIKQQKAL